MSIGLALGFLIAIGSAAEGQTLSSKDAGLKIVVIAGEDAVNIIQQKTAVAPIVEVRDRNDQPVAGALVTFAIRGKAATFASGAQTLSATTTAAGRASGSGLTPLRRGAYDVEVTATFQGQTASLTINQTNVATAAAAQAVGAGVAVGAAGAAAAGGGGLSGVAIGAIAAAAGGGALVAVKAAGSDRTTATPPTPSSAAAPPPAPTPTPPAVPAPATHSGAFSGQLIITTTTASSNLTTTCVATNALNGTVTTLTRAADGSVTGTAQMTGTQNEIAITAAPFCQSASGTASLGNFYPVSGNAGNVTFSGQGGSTQPTPAPGVGSSTCTDARSFSGTLANGEVTGTLTFSRACDGTNNVNGVSSVITGRGTVTIPLTLR